MLFFFNTLDLIETYMYVYIIFCILGLQVSVVGLERALHHYTLEPSDHAFDMKSVPLATQPLVDQKAGEHVLGVALVNI